MVPEREAKSISNETTFERDIADMDVLRAWLVDLTEQVGWRLRRHRLRGRTVQIKVRFADFSTITRSCTLAEPTDITEELWRTAEELLWRSLRGGKGDSPIFADAKIGTVPRLPAGHLPVRLLGVGVSGLDDSGQVQGLLFDGDERQRQSQVDAVADQIKSRFGSGAIRRGSGIDI